MSPKAPRFTAGGIERILSRNGFALVAQRGSHRKWADNERKITVVVPMHGSKVLPIGTTRAIQKASEIPEENWNE